MAPYYFLLLCSFFFCYVAMYKKGRKRVIMVGNAEHIRNQNSGFLVFFILLFVLLACRDASVGNDTSNYKYFFKLYNSQSFYEVLTGEYDILYGILNWITGRFTNEFQVLLVLTSLLTVFFIARFYMEDRRLSYLQIVIFLCIPVFEMMFSGIRQIIACSLGAAAFQYVRKNKIGMYLLCVAIAYGMHSSAFVLLVMYPLYHLRIKKEHLLFIVPMIVVLFIYNVPVFLFLTRIMATLSKDLGTIKITSTGAFAVLVLFVLFAAVAFIIPDERKVDKEICGLRNMLLLSVALQCFAPIHNIAMRINYYYILFIPVTMAKVLSIPSFRYSDVANKMIIVLEVFFTLYFMYSIFGAASSGGMLHIVPYIPFWEG